jgi:hypothetical protein
VFHLAIAHPVRANRCPIGMAKLWPPPGHTRRDLRFPLAGEIKASLTAKINVWWRRRFTGIENA